MDVCRMFKSLTGYIPKLGGLDLNHNLNAFAHPKVMSPA